MPLDNSDLTGANRDAFRAITDLFKQYGLESLAPRVKEYLIAGYSQDTIPIMLQETTEYRERFKGNEERRKKGLPVLSPGEYVQLETTYKTLFRQYGLPAQMFDSNDDLTSYITGDVSPSEMTDRLNMARAAVTADNPYVRDAYRAWYATGLSEGDAIAAVLDPDRALPEIERKVASATLAGAASQQSLTLTRERAEELASMGADTRNAVAAFGQVADVNRNADSIARRYGMDYAGQRDAEDAVLLSDSEAQRKIRKLGQREAGEFGGRGVADSRSFGNRSY